LFRPGPLQSGMVDDFIARKHGAIIKYPHPDLEPILKPTYGIILYQEQVMQIAQVLAGYTLGGADMLRRAMGKKKPEEMAKQRSIFMEGAEKRGVDAKVAEGIFDLMEKFAGYGFNKSHSAAYALVSYQTAWLKAHYPAAFMAAVLSADMDNTDKVVHLIAECRDMQLKVVPPDINLSNYHFTEQTGDTVVYGLGAIKGVGQGAIEGMLAERAAGGPFADLFDLCQRVDLRKVNRRVFDALNRAGALDSLGETRATQQANLAQALQLAEQRSRDLNTGQNDLFGGADPGAAPVTGKQELPEWEEEQRLQGAIDAANNLLKEIPNAVMPWQFGNPANPEIHRRTTAEEIWADTGGKVDFLVSGVGTGGTLTGCGEVLKARNTALKIVAVEPKDSAVLSGGAPGPHALQGLGAGFVPEVLDTNLIDEVIAVSNDDAFAMARKVAKLDGIPVGISSGAIIHAALQVAKRAENKGKTVVCFAPSTAERYMSTPLFEGL